MLNHRLTEGGRADADRRSGHWEPLIRRIMEAAAPELENLRAKGTLAGQISGWTRPLLPVAAALILIFGTILAWMGEQSDLVGGNAPHLAEAILPEPVSLWVQANAEYTLAELLAALEESGR